MVKKEKDIVYGIRAIIELINSGHPIAKILIQQPSKASELRKELIFLAKKNQLPISRVPLAALKKYTTKQHQGVVAFLSPIPFVNLDNCITSAFEEGKNPLVVILDGVSDVRNLGAIARTSLSMGVDALVVQQQKGALINSEAMKASAGALSYLNVCRTNKLSEELKYIKNSGLQIIACGEKSKTPLWKANLRPPTALLLGGEGLGIAPAHKELTDHSFKIPMKGEVSSLNVSVAASVFLYESMRQRMLL